MALVVASAGCVIPPTDPDGPWVLVFTRTEGFQHDSIKPAREALAAELHGRGYGVVVIDDPVVFTPDRLAQFSAVVFLSTTGDVLDAPHETALQNWVLGGGGWVGVHSALDTEYGWIFYGTLAGARFVSHPAVQPATVHVEDSNHPAMVSLPTLSTRVDEWYDVTPNPRTNAHILATVDETTYSGGTMGEDHPVAWCKQIGNGESFVTTLGHTPGAWSDAAFVDLVAGGIESVMLAGGCA